MKKLLIASAIALAATAASALDFGITASRDFSGTDHDSVGVTVGQVYKNGVGITAGFARDANKASDQDRYSLMGSYDVLKFGGSTVAVKAGGVFMANSGAADGSAAVVGAELTVPLTSKIAATFDVSRQYGQDRVSQHDGNRATVGLKYRF